LPRCSSPSPSLCSSRRYSVAACCLEPPPSSSQSSSAQGRAGVRHHQVHLHSSSPCQAAPCNAALATLLRAPVKTPTKAAAISSCAAVSSSFGTHPEPSWSPLSANWKPPCLPLRRHHLGPILSQAGHRSVLTRSLPVCRFFHHERLSDDRPPLIASEPAPSTTSPACRQWCPSTHAPSSSAFPSESPTATIPKMGSPPRRRPP
jgi:hypothetical protein